MKSYKTADAFFEDQNDYGPALNKLRKIIIASGMDETVKWGIPVYTVGGKNVLGISAFKSYFGIWFYQGVFLKDSEKVLINAQEGKTKAMRQWRMQNEKDIDKALVAKYVKEAKENMLAGKEMTPEKKPLVVPPELKKAFKDDLILRDAFEGLSLSFKREYTEYITEAKRQETKVNRIAKILPMIKANVGLNDKYR